MCSYYLNFQHNSTVLWNIVFQRKRWSVLEDAQAQPVVSVTQTQSTLTSIVCTAQRYCNSVPRQTQLTDAVVTSSGKALQRRRDDIPLGQVSFDRCQFWEPHVSQMQWTGLLSVLSCTSIWMFIPYEHVYVLINIHVYLTCAYMNKASENVSVFVFEILF